MFPSLFTTHTGTRPSVWVGCLACLTAGVLRGVWTRAENASSITPADLHEWETAHEELWVFDHEGLPSRIGEIPPSTAHLWGDVFAEVGEERWAAFLAWTENGGHFADAHGIPDLDSFDDRYLGTWSTFGEYLAEEIELLQEGWPEDAVRYFDEGAYERDARFDYTVLDAPDGGVYVFRDC